MAALVASFVVVLPLAFKSEVEAFFRAGDTITAEFQRNYELKANQSRVKTAGLEVGVVTKIEETGRHTCLVTMKVDRSALRTLGPEPSATVTPKTVLGGQYTIDLKRGGGDGPFKSGFIPLRHTHLPVELDRVLEALPRPTRSSMQHVIGEFRDTLARGGRAELRELVSTAPATLGPAAGVFKGIAGTRPGVDLPQVVATFDTISTRLTENQGQLDDILVSLRNTSRVLGAGGAPLADTFRQLPATLRDSRTAVIDLRGTLDRLTETAEGLRPSARKLGSLVETLDPALEDIRPLADDLRPAIADLRPTADALVPISERGTDVLDDLDGPVLDRINGPILGTVLHPYRGSGPYSQTGGGMQADHSFFQELAYMATNLDRASMTQDAQGSALGFQVGASSHTVVTNTLGSAPPLTWSGLLDQLRKNTGGSR